MVDTTTYENTLRHVARPSSPSERETAVGETVEDYTALWFTEVLREYAHYEADERERQIAIAYAQYVDQQVREQEQDRVTLYAHTADAATVLHMAVNFADTAVDPCPLVDKVEGASERLIDHFVEGAIE